MNGDMGTNFSLKNLKSDIQKETIIQKQNFN